MASTRTTTPDLPAAPAEQPAEAAPQLLTFIVAGGRYGCRLEAVREIFVARPTARLPGAPPHVLGLLNVRGTLLTVVDIGCWLEGRGALGSRLSALGDGGNAEDAEGAEAAELGRRSGASSSASAPSPSTCSTFPPAGSQQPRAEIREPGAGSASSGHVLVVESEGRLGGCRVDGLGRAMGLPALDPAPGGNAAAGGIVLGVGEADGELVAVLDLPRLVSLSLLFPGER